jgi:DivIVA domain-containing protein
MGGRLLVPPLAPGEIFLFWFLLIALVSVVAAVALAVLGDGGVLSNAEPDGLHDPLPVDRPLGQADVDALRLPAALRGYRMSEVDDVLDRLSAELTERDARIAELEAALAGARVSRWRPQPPGSGDERNDENDRRQRSDGNDRSDLSDLSGSGNRTNPEGPR